MSNAIFSAMAAILKEVDAIEKTRSSTGSFSFKFRGIDDAMNTLHDVFAKYQVFITHEILEHTMHERTSEKVYNGNKETKLSFHHIVKVAFRFWHADGSNVSAIGIGEAADSGDKGAGKAMSYALKVCLLQTFLIPTEEIKDPDYEQHEFNRPVPAPKPSTPAPKPAPKPKPDVWESSQSTNHINACMADMEAAKKAELEKPLPDSNEVYDYPKHRHLVVAAAKELGISAPRITANRDQLNDYLIANAFANIDSVKSCMAAYFKKETP